MLFIVLAFVALGLVFDHQLTRKAIYTMSQSMDKLTAQISGVEVSASNLATQVGGMQTEISMLKSQIATLSAGQENAAQIDTLTARLAVVQSALDALTAQLAPAAPVPAAGA